MGTHVHAERSVECWGVRFINLYEHKNSVTKPSGVDAISHCRSAVGCHALNSSQTPRGGYYTESAH
jgi:hypothetical protein